MNYEILEDGKAIKCLECGLTSWHPEDVRHRYCGFCSVFHETPEHKRVAPPSFGRVLISEERSRVLPLTKIEENEGRLWLREKTKERRDDAVPTGSSSEDSG